MKWAFGYAGATSAGGPPTVIGERIFVAGGDGQVYLLDQQSGCVFLDIPASGARSHRDYGQRRRKDRVLRRLQGRAYAVDTSNGSLRWKTDLDEHPFANITGAPRLYGGKLYVPMSSFEELGAANPKYLCCTFRGSMNALDAKTGKVLWKSSTISEPARSSTNESGITMTGPSGAGVWSSPTIDPDRHALYFGTGDNYSEPANATSDAVIALDKGEREGSVGETADFGGSL